MRTMIVFLGEKKMKDKKPRASYRRGRGVAMSPRGRSTVAPSGRKFGGRPQAPTLPVNAGGPKLKPKRGGLAMAQQQQAAGGGGRRSQRRDLVMPTRGRPKAPKLTMPTFPRGQQGKQVGSKLSPATAPVSSPVMQQQKQAGKPAPMKAPTSMVMPSRGNRAMFNKGGKAGYGSVQDMEKACMVKSDHNPSMRQK